MAELIIDEKMLYMLTSSEFYEPLERYRPILSEHHDPVAKILPPQWRLSGRGLWMDCSRTNAEIPPQGWKIHLSATPGHAPAILTTVARELFAEDVPFKFIIDRQMLMLVNSKRWHRGSAGKFITVYPRDDAHSAHLLERLHHATIGYWGPYILSDRRYSTSRIVHYRYGGFHPTKRIDVSGRSVHVIQSEDGSYIDDDRTPFFHLPPGIEDPFENADSKSKDETEPGTLKDSRYRIEKVLAYSNTGGVYLAEDRELGRTVVIKEARPHTNVSLRGLDAAQLLKKEHRLLKVLAGSGIAPEPYDFFIDWEHSYLVEEYLEGRGTLRDSITRLCLALQPRPSLEDSREFYRQYRIRFSRLAELMQALHARDIVFSDLSMANVMVLEKDGELADMKLIDFEGAYEQGVDVPTHLFTPGFSPEETETMGKTIKEGDYYALGSLMLAGLFPMNSLLTLNRSAYEAYLEAYQEDFDLPVEIAQLIRDLLHPDPLKRPPPDQVVRILGGTAQVRAPRVTSNQLDRADVGHTLGRIVDYVHGTADLSRTDRLYPADPMVFETNPLGVAHGALGVALAMHRVGRPIAQDCMEWIVSALGRRPALPPGLFIGSSGIAWALLEMGYHDLAMHIADGIDDHPLLWRSADLFNGAAGWGMTQLRFFMHSGDQRHLDNARRAATYLAKQRTVAPGGSGGCYWETPEGISPSLGHGASGIALFLLYLSQVTGDRSCLDLGREAIEWVISKGIRNPRGGMSWYARDRTPSYTPYLRWGSSGIGRVMLRYWHATGEARYGDLIDQIHLDCDHKYTIFPGYLFGTAGIAEMYLDMARFERWQGIAEATIPKLLSGCLLFPVEKQAGLAFPGESLSRISCDLGTGGAGIALVMHRHLTRCGPTLMLDDLLKGWVPTDRPLSSGLEKLMEEA